MTQPPPGSYPPGSYPAGGPQFAPPPKRPWYKKAGCLIPLIIVLALVVFGGCTAGLVAAGSKDATTPAPAASVQAGGKSSGSGATDTQADANVPAEYKSALAKAQSYAEMMHMSKKAVRDQLTSDYGEKFSQKAADYAMQNVKADWNANALAKAKSYQDDMKMSPNAIHDQLVSSAGERFTEAEADYAIKHLS